MSAHVEMLEQRQMLAGDLVAQWQAQSLVESVADQATVTTWADRVSGIAANATGQPKLIAGAINGRAAVRFDPSDGVDLLKVASAASPMRNATDFSLVVAFTTDATTIPSSGARWFENAGLIDANSLGFGTDWGVTINDQGRVMTGMGGGIAEPPQTIVSDVSGLNDGQLLIATVTRSGSNLKLYIGDRLAAETNQANAAARSPVDFGIGATVTGTFGFPGDIAEVRIYNGQLSAAEVTAVHQQLDSFYNNAPPVGVADTYTLPEDADFFQSLVPVNRGVLNNDTDPDGDPLTAVLIQGTSHGTLNLSPDGSFVYDSHPNFFGTDQFIYAPVDFRAGNPVTVTLNVTPTYDKPTAVPEQYKLRSGTVLNVAAANGLLTNDVNPDQVTMAAQVTRAVSHGQLTLNADGSFRYDPQGFAGRASFAYRISDGTGFSDPAEVVLIVNTPPEARDDNFTVDEDTTLNRTAQTGVLANDFDAERDALVASVVEQPRHGVLVFSPDGSFRYTPSANYFGPDSFTYQLTDGEDGSNTATVRLTVRSVNDAPVAVGDTYFTRVNEALPVAASSGVLRNDTDIEGDRLTAKLVTGPQNGTLTLAADGSFQYTPRNGFTGVDRFTYRANDGQADSAPAEVVIAINSLVEQQQIVINEVHVDPDIKTELVEFIELYNRGSVPVNLSGWRLNNAVNFVFPDGVAIEPGGYVVVTENPDDFQEKFSRAALGPWSGKLSNDGEDIELWTPAGDLIDLVDYNIGFPWPTFGESPGPSIQLINPQFDNGLGGNWMGALPTPGQVNSVLAVNAAPQMRRVAHLPQEPKSGETVTISALITDPDGVQSVVLDYQLVNPGDYFSMDDPRYATSWSQVPMLDNGQAGDATAGDGIYTAVLPADVQMHRRLVRYRITSTDGLGAARTAPYEDDLQPNFAYFVYDGVPDWTGAARPGQTPNVTFSSDLLTSIPVYHLITTHDSHVDSQYITDSDLRSGYTGDDYNWSGTMVYDGKVYDHIGFRARGGVWRYAMGKNMWKFDFHRGHQFQARDNYGNEYSTTWDNINFSSIIQQGDYLHRGEQGLFESVGFKLFNMAGTESPNTHYVHFRIVKNADEQGDNQFSSDFQGLYLAIEQQDGNFLDEHELPDGNFYKIENYAPESIANQGPTQVSDRSDARSFIREFQGNRRPTVEWWEQNLDLERYYGYQAISQAIHHYDTAFGKNYYYFNNPETGKWQIHPWDLDLTWADNMFGNENHEFNVKVARNAEFNEYENPANLTLNNRFNADYQNRLRELMDLLYNPEQTGMLIDQFASVVYQPGQASLVDADRAMWDANPINSVQSRYTNSSKNNTNPRHRYYERAATKDFPGMIQLMKNYVESRSRWMERTILTNQANIPQTPVVSYTGAPGYAMNQLRFATSAFASPIGASFAAMEWRLAEVTDPTAPGFDPYDRTQPRKYEIDAIWESGELPTFENEVTISSHSMEPGQTYRVRVRMKDNDGHWSHWSEPVQFVSSPGNDTQLSESLRVSEVHYHPADPSPSEIAAGFTDADDFEFLELVNRGSTTIDLRSVTLDRFVINGEEEGVQFAFADGAITQLAPGNRLVVVENLDAFRLRYGNAVPVAGEWSGGLRNSSEQITLSAFGSIIQQFTYSDAWHPTTDGEGPSLEIVDIQQSDANLWNLAAGWQPSAVAGGTPGTGSTPRVPGDSNGDGRFDSSDLVQVFQRGQYEDNVLGNSTWEDGDWNGDGDFTTSDLVFAFTAGTYQSAAARMTDDQVTDQVFAEAEGF